MRWLIIPLILTGDAGYPPMPLDDPRPSDVDECEEGIKDLKNSILGLEFFLADKKKLKEHDCNNSTCTYAKWKQPRIEKYKENPKSYLPESCKTDKVEFAPK
jgi:hypothetical protein